MATVRFSGELKEQVRKSAKAMFQQRIDNAKASMPADWGNRIYDRAFGKYTPQLNAVPVEFLSFTDKLEIEIPLGSTEVDVTVPLTNRMPVPRGVTPSDCPLFKRNSWTDTFQLSGATDWADIIIECREWQERIAVATKQRDDFVAGVNQVMEAYATLAPALKVFPALWDLLPEPVKDKHREVKDKTLTRDNTLTVDLSALSAQVAFHKMTK